MRFDQLRLTKYGHFSDAIIDFGTGAIDLQIVAGQNEAGKSTIVSAVSDFLFGFPHSTSYAFRFDQKLLSIGATVSNSGEALSLNRRKGRAGNSLLDETGEVVPEATLAGLLGGQSKDTFLRMFSLDHERLREGGRAILDAKDDVGQAIFAAGSGLTRVASVLDSLEEEAKTVWAKRAAGDRLYYRALKEYDDAKARVKAAQVKSSAWVAACGKVDDLAADLARLRASRSSLQAEVALLERHRRVMLPLAHLRLATKELEEFGDVAVLPANAVELLSQASMLEASAKAATERATAQAQEARGVLAALAVNPVLVELREEIQTLAKQVGAVEKALVDLPKRREERMVSQRQLVALCNDLGWGEMDVATIRGRLPTRRQTAVVRGLLEERSGIDGALKSATDMLEIQSRDVQNLERAASMLPPARDVSAVSAALRLAGAFGDLDTAVLSAEQSCADASRRLQDELAKLSPWTGAAADLERLALPAEAQTHGLGAALSQAETGLEKARDALRLAKKTRDEETLTHDQMIRDDKAVSAEDIAGKRRQRDGIWGEISAELGGGRIPAEWERVSGTYEGAVKAADSTADRRFEVAEQSGRLVVVRERLEKAKLAVQHAEQAETDAELAVSQAKEAWDAATAGIVALAPQGFTAWLEKRMQTMDALRTRQKAEAERDRVRGHLATARGVLLTALQAAVATPLAMLDALPLKGLVSEAERVEREAAAQEKNRAELATRRQSAQTALDRAEAGLKKAQAGSDDWLGRWTSAVVGLGLNAADPPDSIRVALDVFDEIRTLCSDIARLDERISGMEVDVAAFRTSVATLSSACGLQAVDREPADVLRELQSQADQAQTAATHAGLQREQLEKAEQELQRARQDEEKATTLLRPLIDLAGTETRSDLAQAIDKSDTLRSLRTKITGLQEDIVKAGDGLDYDAIIKDCVDTDPVELARRVEAAQQKIGDLNVDIERIGGEHATASAAFNALDDRPDAAVAAADMAQARAEMEFQAEAYIRKRTEAALLRSAIERYRKERQAPLLKRAAELFKTLTLERYEGLIVDTESGDTPTLSGVLAGGDDVVPVGGMSEGTIDQLYLALRVAAVESAVAADLKLPFIADDLFINFDNNRAGAGFRVLAELASQTQVLFFTHHHHLLAIAEQALAPRKVTVCPL